MKKYIPNFITLVNLFCGCCALASVFYGQFLQAFWFSFASGIADYFDGMLARWMETKSPLGKELDSLADMVSFGVVPGAILYILLVHGLEGGEVELPMEKLIIAASPAFLVSVFAALRLANFNLDTRQTDSFIGLSTPPCTMFTIGLMLIYHFDSFGLKNLVCSPFFLYPTIVVLCFLLVAEFPMFSFKFKQLGWKGNEIRIIFATLAVSMLFLLQEASFSLIIIAYVLFALIDNLFIKNNPTS